MQIQIIADSGHDGDPSVSVGGDHGDSGDTDNGDDGGDDNAGAGGGGAAGAAGEEMRMTRSTAEKTRSDNAYRDYILLLVVCN